MFHTYNFFINLSYNYLPPPWCPLLKKSELNNFKLEPHKLCKIYTLIYKYLTTKDENIRNNILFEVSTVEMVSFSSLRSQ